MTHFTPRPADVASPGALILAVYDVLSGEAHAPRDWMRFRTFYAPTAVLRPIRVVPAGPAELDAFGVEEYIASRAPMLTPAPFYEVEIARKEFRFGQLAHVFSHYESRRTPDGSAFSSGINSIQLFNDGVRWWILSVMWDWAREGVAPFPPLE